MENGFYKEMDENKKRINEKEIKSEIDEIINQDNLYIYNIRNDIEKQLNFISNNKYYEKVWNLLFQDKIKKILSDKKLLNSYLMRLQFKTPFNSNFIDLNKFFSCANIYNFRFIWHIYKKILKINSENNEFLNPFIIDKFWNFQNLSREIIRNWLNEFEIYLRNILMTIIRVQDLPFNKIKFTPKILQNPTPEFKKYIESITTIENLKSSNENIEIVFEEMNFSDYIELIRKFENESFKNLFRLIFKNYELTANWNSWDFYFKNFNELDSEKIRNFKAEYIEELKNVKDLRNKIYHNKTVIFDNWLNQDDFKYFESIKSLSKIFYYDGIYFSIKYKKQLIKVIQDMKEDLIFHLPNKIKIIENYFKKYFI
ncbi:MAG: hypothetical protein HPPSJP_4510 [Candidatus Hepatoplasma scabrum]|nr:MAG: hypothetical protein HPPSJP_4510 [Candidatus Hepatoplasma sp.]